MKAPPRADARNALDVFRGEFDAKYPKATAKLDRDWKQLTAFYAFPAEHWRHIRTTDDNVKGLGGACRGFPRVGSVGRGSRRTSDRLVWPRLRVGPPGSDRFQACSGYGGLGATVSGR